jgi:hypothetical protein
MSQPQHEPNQGPDIATPLWVKILGAIAVVVIVAFLLLHLTGHAPMGHGG